MDRKIVVFCSSSYDIDTAYNEAARDFVRGVCAKDYTVVSGGAIKGMMGVVSETVFECGGRHKGVIPRFMTQYIYPHLTETVWTDTMSERKERMREGTCAAVALPGGIGTMDELFETHVLSKLGQYDGKIYALNINGFYDPLKALLESFVETKMTTREDVDRLVFCDSVEELLKHF